MNASKFKELVGSHFFTVEFKKKDGSIRKMTARTGVSRYVKGNGAGLKDGIVGVYEVNAGRKGAANYRSLWPDTVISLKAGGKVYDGDGNEVK